MAEVANKEIEYNEQMGGIVDSDGSGMVMYSEDINPEVLAKVCELYNEGKSKKEIQNWLDTGTQLCTVEEGDYIIEQLTMWEKVPDSTVVDKKDAGPAGLASAYTGQGAPTMNSTGTQIAPTEKKEPSRGEKAAATRKANAEGAKKAGNGNKVTSVASVRNSLRMQVEKATESISVVDYVEALSTDAKFPEGLRKEYTDLLIKFVKAVELVKSEYITALQEL